MTSDQEQIQQLTALNLTAGDWWMSVQDDGRRHVIIMALHGEALPLCVTP
jgi:hypothetical protein